MKKLLVLLIFSLALTGCAATDENAIETDVEPTLQTVGIQEVEAGTISKTQNYVGVIEPKDNIILTSEVGGTVKEILFDEGDAIKEGEVFLSLLDDGGKKENVQLNLDLATSSLETAKTNLENTKKANAAAVATAESNLASITISISNIQKQINDAGRGNESKKDSLAISIDTVQLQVDQLNTTIQDTIANNTIQISVAKNSVATAEEALKNARDTKDNTEDLGAQSVDQAKLYLEQLEDSLNELEDSDTATDAQILDLEMKIEAQKEAIKTAKLSESANNDQVDSNMSIQQIQLDSAREKLSQLESALTLQLSNLYNQLDIANKQLESAKQSVSNADVQTDIQINQLENQIASLKEQEKLAKSSLESTKVNAAQMLAQAELQVKQAQTNADAAALTLDDFTIKSTIDGLVESVLVTEGQTINPGQQVASIVIPEDYVIVVYVPWKEAKMVDKSAELTIVLGGETYPGTIDLSSVTVDKGTQTVKYEISSDLGTDSQFINSIVDVGMVFKLENNGDRIYIPLSAVNVGSEKKSVFVLEDNNQVKEVYITTGEVLSDNIEVTEGLQVGQKLIVKGQRNVRDGQYVQVKSDNELTKNDTK